MGSGIIQTIQTFITSGTCSIIRHQTPAIGVSTGNTAGFNVLLEKPLESPVCSIEAYVSNPKNVSFNMIVGNLNNSVEYAGNLDAVQEIINIEGCIAGVEAIAFKFDAPDKWTTLSEVKLFSNETVDPGPVEPPVCLPGTHLENGVCVPDVVIPEPGVSNITKLNINNSTVYANITDSKVVLNIGGDSQVIENNANPPVIPPPPQPPVVTPPTEEPEEEEENGEDEDDKKDKDKKDDDKN